MTNAPHLLDVLALWDPSDFAIMKRILSAFMAVSVEMDGQLRRA
jgi:hypothetical protein